MTGTGTLFFLWHHLHNSPNFKAPFTTVNCAAIPKDLIESEFFGYEKGAFSGADAIGKKGLIEQAAKLLNINHHTFRYRKKKLLGE